MPVEKSAKRTIRLVCWDPEAAAGHIRRIEKSLPRRRFEFDASGFQTSGMTGRLRSTNTVVVVFDLNRRPALARDIATAIRATKSTSQIPIVFAGGLPEKVALVRAALPEATFTDWDEAGAAVANAIANPAPAGTRPQAHMERYAGSSLAKKLGVKPGMGVALLGSPPDEFEESVSEQMEDAAMSRRVTPQTGMALWFVQSRDEVDLAAVRIAAWLADDRQAWMIYPKQAGRLRVDFTQHDVRAAGIAAGLVDYKICAVDADWSGLKFARRKR